MNVYNCLFKVPSVLFPFQQSMNLSHNFWNDLDYKLFWRSFNSESRCSTQVREQMKGRIYWQPLKTNNWFIGNGPSAQFIYQTVIHLKNSRDTYLSLFDFKGMTKSVMRLPIPTPPWSPHWYRCLRLWESRSLCRQSRGSISAGGRPFVPSCYWDVWRGFEVLLLDTYQRIPVKHPWRGSRRNKGSQG